MRNATAGARALGSTAEDPILESTWDVFPVAIKDAPVPANARITWANFANQSNSVATFDVSSNVVAPYVQLDSTLAGRCAAAASYEGQLQVRTLIQGCQHGTVSRLPLRPWVTCAVGVSTLIICGGSEVHRGTSIFMARANRGVWTSCCPK